MNSTGLSQNSMNPFSLSGTLLTFFSQFQWKTLPSYPLPHLVGKQSGLQTWVVASGRLDADGTRKSVILSGFRGFLAAELSRILVSENTWKTNVLERIHLAMMVASSDGISAWNFHHFIPQNAWESPTKELMISVRQTTAHIRTDAQYGALFRNKACQR